MTDLTPGPVTLLDVANEAGVSLATASRAINGSTRKVREDLRERVLEAAIKLNYSANAPAQAMARGRTDVVGLIVHDIADPYFSSIAAGVMGAAESHDLLVTLGSTVRRPERELDYLRVLRGQRSRAVILAGSRVDDESLLARLREQGEAFERSGGRVVVISQNRLPFDTVVIENRSGAKALATELTRLGYRSFAVLGGPNKLLTARDRVLGYRDGITKAGLPAPLVVHGDFTRDGGYNAMGDVLDSGTPVDCVLAVNDVMAVGAMAACRARGLRLPQDMALAGFDDIGTLRDVVPSLTTVRLPLEQIGALALNLVVSADDAGEARTRRVKGEVLVRESTPGR
ncbi:LacI family DNA-binding transcriptional regulator [Terrabacter sp. MAHUQ-38]|jgi:LacI family transcriptional regulator|uniref:LacI family DNA-binding transcriptional regulator n=1 Tax=unclassified Terrabacter TaxID=2630222 RepID=UPI00165E538D|nr:LacI family DNA-binding transcriptional regulator [Terrabacter sp. MAHUQ-38]MBC9824102.1 LacI family DNA-binding transcriptional regulator [Terrabacter sp. MAHUQ-38]